MVDMNLENPNKGKFWVEKGWRETTLWAKK